MGIRDAIGLRFMPGEAKAALSEMRDAYAYGQIATGRQNRPVWGKHSPGAYQDEGYRKLALVFRCVGITATSAAKASLVVKVNDAKGAPMLLPDDPMRRLMLQPNPQMRENRFLSLIFTMASVAGFCVIEKERDNVGNVVGLWPLEPHRCAPVLRNQAAPDWDYRVEGIREPFRIKAEDAIVYTYADTADLSPRGIGPVEVAFREVGMLNVMTDFLKAFFDVGAIPQYGLVLDEDKNGRMTQAKADDIKRKFGRRYSGLMRSVEPAILEGIKDIKRLSFDMDELAYSDLRDLSDAAVCQAFGVSPMLVDAHVGLTNSTYSNKEDARRGFYDETITALWDRFDDVMTLGLVNEFGLGPASRYFVFDTSRVRALRDDIDKRGAWAVPAMSAGAITNYTFADVMNLPRPEGPEFYLRGMATVAIPADDPLELATTPAPVALPVATSTTTPAPVAAPAATKARAIVVDEVRALGPGSSPSETRASHAAINRANLVAITNRSRPWLAKYFREAKTRILDETSRASAASWETRGAETIDWNREANALKSVLTRMYSAAGELAYGAAGKQLGVTGLAFDLANPKTASVRNLLATQVTNITEESKRVVAHIVTKGLQEGKLLAGIQDDLIATMDTWSESRALMVARTESMLSYGFATAAAYRESNVVDRIQCFDNPDHTDDYGAADGLSCAERDGFIDDLDSAELHIASEHPNGSLVLAGVLIGDE